MTGDFDESMTHWTASTTIEEKGIPQHAQQIHGFYVRDAFTRRQLEAARGAMVSDSRLIARPSHHGGIISDLRCADSLIIIAKLYGISDHF